MSEFINSTGFMLVVYSNKNSALFGKASKNVISEYKDKEGVTGVIYDDFDAKNERVQEWTKRFPGINIYKIAPRRKTLRMDDKIHLSESVGHSEIIPKWYTKIEDIPKTTAPNQLYFVKKRGSTAARGVSAHRYKDLNNVDVSNCIIQEDMVNPHLYENRRYKIRVYVLLRKGKMYINQKAWCSLGGLDYRKCDEKMTDQEIKDINIIYQAPGRKWFVLSDIENYTKIFNSMALRLKDLKKTYIEKIDSIEDNEFTLLGVDYVIDDKYNAYIIEINHRSNYHHPDDIVEKVDLPALQDTLKMLVDGTTKNTSYVEV